MACRVRPGYLKSHDSMIAEPDFHCLQVGKYLSRHHINTEANGHMDCPRFSIRPKGQLFHVARCWCDGTAFNDSSDLSALMSSACRILHDFPLGSNIFKTKTLSLESAWVFVRIAWRLTPFRATANRLVSMHLGSIASSPLALASLGSAGS